MKDVEVKKDGKKYYIEIPEKYITEGKLKLGEKYRIGLYSLENENNSAGRI